MTQFVAYTVFGLIAVVWAAYMVTILWWDCRGSKARLARLDELARTIQDPTLPRAAKLEAGVELFDIRAELAERLMQKDASAAGLGPAESDN